MDFHDSRYFNVNKQMLKLMGLWPYQGIITKFFIRTIIIIFYVVFYIPHVYSFVMYLGSNGDKALFSGAVIIYFTAIFLKFFCVMVSIKKTRIMYEAINENWKLLSDKNELNILKEHSEFGRLLTIGYIAYMYSAGGGFVTLPMIPIFIDYAFPINGTRIRIFILDGEYGVDKYEYYGNIYAFEAFACIWTTFTFCALDTTYSTCVQQCVGLMAVVKRRLEIATKQIRNVGSSSKDDAYYAMKECIKLHKNSIDFANILETTYSVNFLVVMMTNSLILSVGSVVIIMNLNKPMELLRFGLIYIGLFIHMFYLRYNNEWYECSIKTQKLLRFMMMRCKEPCHLTAGGLYVMNFANFGSLAKTSMSYITVFSSYR